MGTNIFIEILFSPGYYGYLLSAALYGLCLGCLLYTSKLYCYNSVKAKEFGHVWSMVAASQAVSALGGIMVTGINSSKKALTYYLLRFIHHQKSARHL